MAPAEDFDVFLSHGTPDKPWVETLASELRTLGLKPFYDLGVLEAADSSRPACDRSHGTDPHAHTAVEGGQTLRAGPSLINDPQIVRHILDILDKLRSGS